MKLLRSYGSFEEEDEFSLQTLQGLKEYLYKNWAKRKSKFTVCIIYNFLIYKLYVLFIVFII